MATSWGRHDQPADAVERILDAATRLYVQQGVDDTTMRDIAAEAGCARATLYLYFPSKAELRVALRNRAALEIAGRVSDAVAQVDEATPRLTLAILTAVREVRASPLLMTWFDRDHLALTLQLARSAELVDAVAATIADDFGSDRPELGARLVIRIVLSLITTPGDDDADERRLVEALLAGL